MLIVIALKYMEFCLFIYTIGEDFNWRRGCIEREETHTAWSDPLETHDHIPVTEGFFAAVDVVHLLKVKGLVQWEAWLTCNR